MVNCLSIDWDYFLTATATERVTYFPDGSNEDIPPKIQQHAWAVRYGRYGHHLTDITVQPIELIKEIIKAIPPYAMVGISESHKDSYYFFKERLRYCKNEEVNLLHIDHHSDTRGWFNDSFIERIDCGNWLAHFMRSYHGTFRWLCNTDSDVGGCPNNLERFTEIENARISETDWDVVHICRSDLWSPPHLDTQFTSLFKSYAEDFGATVEDGIWESRFNKEMQNDIAQIKERYDDMEEQGIEIRRG
jgi:hypothetical protein